MLFPVIQWFGSPPNEQLVESWQSGGWWSIPSFSIDPMAVVVVEWHLGSMGRERLAWARGSRFHTEEFYVKVLKFEIMNSWKLFNYSSREVRRIIEFVPQATLSPGRFKNGSIGRQSIFKSKLGIVGCWWVPTHHAHRFPPPLPGYLKGWVGNLTRLRN